MKSWLSSVRLRQSLAAGLGLFLLLWVVDELENADSPTFQSSPTAKHRIATVVQPQAEVQMPALKVLGQVESSKLVELTSNVDGRVIGTSAEFKRGAALAPSQWLLQLDPLPYQAAVAEAKVALMNANMALKNAHAQYAHNSLMVETAKAQQQHYQLLAKQAQQNLEQTRISLPFAGELIAIKAHIGEHIALGQSIATVLPRQGQDISVALSEQQFALLQKPLNQQVAIVRDLDNKIIGEASIRGISQYSSQLQRQLYLTPNQDSSLVTGKPVHIELPLTPWQNIYSIPESSLTAQHEVWWLDGNNKVQRCALSDFILHNDRVFFHWPTSIEKQASIIAYPSDALAQGMLIKPKTLMKDPSRIQTASSHSSPASALQGASL